MSQVEFIVRSLLVIIKQHQRRRTGDGLPVVVACVEDLALVASARTGLDLHDRALRPLLDGMVRYRLLGREGDPAPFKPSTYWVTISGPQLDLTTVTFSREYRPTKWKDFQIGPSAIAGMLSRYEYLWRSKVGGLPRHPDLLELSRQARLNVGSLARRLRTLAERPPRGQGSRKAPPTKQGQPAGQ